MKLNHDPDKALPPTPRTDDQIGYNGSTMQFVRIDFARKLERELADAKAAASESGFADLLEIIDKLKAERDKLRAALETLTHAGENLGVYLVNHKHVLVTAEFANAMIKARTALATGEGK